ncbi:polyphosphate kinase 1 [Collinsella sp. An2]|uniref:polyphosphate kinase 1 n=1 Tax=Collinsella sp. An2 TaxID=1965585 RepID=UPI000B37B6DF|nr:polyphosphate kinase 1 [Collinsella sp. An2]OUP08633.1 polyphosphate kinase 1 [Collinsella sp. An2]
MAAKADKKAKDKGDKKHKGGVTEIPRSERYDFSYTQNRELSWLRFDNRVLDEAFDTTVPLFERIKFVAIFESNLDEFFMIRIGGLSDLATLKRQPVDNKSNMTPSEQIDRVFETLPPLMERATGVFHSIESSLASWGVHRVTPDNLAGDERTFVERYFQSYVSPIISPLVIDPRHPFPNLRNGALYLACGLDSVDEGRLLGLIEIPSSMNRVVEIPSAPGEYRYILLEDIILTCLNSCFGSYTPLDRAVIRVIRNADIDPDGEGVEEEEDYRLHMKRILKKRLRLQPVCLNVSGSLEPSTLKTIRKSLDLTSRAVMVRDIPLDLGYVYSLESHLPETSRSELLFTPFRPQPSPMFQPGRRICDQVIEGDKLLFYPYESMNTLLDLMHEAAFDEACISMRITLYRVAKQSRLCEALIDAAENGKEVTVLMELRARFDEQNNIEWAERLEEAGCTVIYGSEGFKCHSKICQLTYRHGMALTRITLLGTGNFNEKTARLYSDFMLMTAHPGIGEDANSFFRNLALGNLRGHYRYLGVAPAGLKPMVMNGLNREIERALAGEPARVFFKMNSLTDREIIDKIVEASQAGVQVEMIIRGISCLLPGIPGKTENVHIRSIVGRFLEHARVYSFGVDADIIYLSSADMMTRNTEHRVEIAYPVLDPACRELVRGYVQAQLDDNVKARELSSTGEWEKIKLAEGEKPFNSQEFLLAQAYARAAAAEEARKAHHAKVAVGEQEREAAAETLRAAEEETREHAAEAKHVASEGEVECLKPTAAAEDADTTPKAASTDADAPAQPAADTEVASTAAPAAEATSAAESASPAPEVTPSKPMADEATSSARPEHTSSPAPASPQPTSEIPVQATLIEPEQPTGSQPATDAPKTPASSAAATRTTLAKRQPGRLRTGLALIGLGIKTLIRGNADSSGRQ